MSASAQCPHFNFGFNVEIARLEDDTIKYADITGKCTDCGKPIIFRCDLPMGVDWRRPTLSPDRQELRLPCSVEGDEVDENKPRIGFSIRGI